MEAEIILAGLHGKLAAIEQQLTDLQAAVTKGDPAGAFFLAAWKAANRTIAELRVELARERERTAEMLGASVRR